VRFTDTCSGNNVTPKLNFGTCKTGYIRTRDHLTRTRPDPWNAYPTRRPLTAHAYTPPNISRKYFISEEMSTSYSYVWLIIILLDFRQSTSTDRWNEKSHQEFWL